jgi:DNA gyrase/topoisomerase IV subunit B
MKENEDEEIEIVHLKFPDNVRRRPGMYIGGVDNADVILREVVDNSIDELFNCKSCDNIVSNKQGSWYVTSDNGRGIPIYITEEGMTATELACSSLHAGSKFDKTLSSASIGLNGVNVYWLQ